MSSLAGLQCYFLLGCFFPVTDAVTELLSLLAGEFSLLGALEESSVLCL